MTSNYFVVVTASAVRNLLKLAPTDLVFPFAAHDAIERAHAHAMALAALAVVQDASKPCERDAAHIAIYTPHAAFPGMAVVGSGELTRVKIGQVESAAA